MKTQTKLAAALSVSALLAIGGSMPSFAATGWAEENGTWVYYERDGGKATDCWKKSGNSWYYLDDSGEMAMDQLIDDGSNYFYVDINGVMAANQWVAIDNPDAGTDDEPDHYWYYFQSNGKAMTNGNNSRVALKTINGKKYAFDEEGKMLYGWVAEDSASRVDNSGNDGFINGDYYFGDSDDGAMAVGWMLLDITYDDAASDNTIAPVFNEDADQSRWFYFQSNGKKVKAADSSGQKEKTINGKKYAFDQYGAMIAEWSRNEDDYNRAVSTANTASGVNGASGMNTASGSQAARISQSWRYFNSIEDGSRLSKGWFKVVPAEALDSERYNDDEENWYYADGSGNIYAGEFKTIKGKRYAFQNDGRMVSGLKFIKKESGSIDVYSEDDSQYPFDTESDFIANAVNYYEGGGYQCYYFGGSEDGAMKTDKTAITIDGEKFNFYFEKSGGSKGAGVTGLKDKKLYQSGMLMKAGTDEKYQVVARTRHTDGGSGSGVYETYEKLDDVEAFLSSIGGNNYIAVDLSGYAENTDMGNEFNISNLNKKEKDLSELYIIKTGANNKDQSADAEFDIRNYSLVNTSGKVIDSRSKSRDGNDYYYVTDGSGHITAVYAEN